MSGELRDAKVALGVMKVIPTVVFATSRSVVRWTVSGLGTVGWSTVQYTTTISTSIL